MNESKGPCSLSRSPASASESAGTPPRWTRRHGEGILLVEDDETVRYITLRILTHAGYQVVTAANGIEALGLLQTWAHELCLVISDYEMPLLDGDGLGRHVRSRYPWIKVLRTSGGAAALRVPAAELKQSADGFLAKPFTMVEIQQAVLQVLEGEPTSG